MRAPGVSLRGILSLAVHRRCRAGSDSRKFPPRFSGTWAGLGLNPGRRRSARRRPSSRTAASTRSSATSQRPWAFAQHEALEWNTDDTGQVCKLDGIFRQGHGTGAGNFRFVEAAGNKLYQVWSSVDEHGLARIYLDSSHPRNVPLTCNGDARGRFEGDDTFVVDIVGFNTKSWLELRSLGALRGAARRRALPAVRQRRSSSSCVSSSTIGWR